MIVTVRQALEDLVAWADEQQAMTGAEALFSLGLRLGRARLALEKARQDEEELIEALDGEPVCGAGIVGCSYGDDRHYHCSKCDGVTGMMGHYAGAGKPFSCETEKPLARSGIAEDDFDFAPPEVDQ